MSASSSVKASPLLINRAHFEAAYWESTKKHGFIEYTQLARDDILKYSVHLGDVKKMFKTASTWKKIKSKDGHVKYKNIITDVVVEFKVHTDGKKDNKVDAGAVGTVLEQVQKHLNILGNDLFQYHVKGWPKPNYDAALRKYKEWKGLK